MTGSQFLPAAGRSVGCFPMVYLELACLTVFLFRLAFCFLAFSSPLPICLVHLEPQCYGDRLFLKSVIWSQASSRLCRTSFISYLHWFG